MIGALQLADTSCINLSGEEEAKGEVETWILYLNRWSVFRVTQLLPALTHFSGYGGRYKKGFLCWPKRMIGQYNWSLIEYKL